MGKRGRNQTVLQGAAKSSRVPTWRFELPAPRGEILACGGDVSAAARSRSLRLCGKVYEKGMEEVAGRTTGFGKEAKQKRGRRPRRWGQEPSFSSRGGQGISPEKKIARSPRSWPARTLGSISPISISSSSSGRSPSSNRGSEEHGTERSSVSCGRTRRAQGSRRKGAQLRKYEECSGASRGASNSKGEGRRRRRKARPEEESQPKETKQIQEEETGFKGQQIRVGGEQQFFDGPTTSEESCSRSGVSPKDAPEECLGRSCRISRSGKHWGRPADKLQSTVSILPDSGETPDARKGERHARAGDNRPLHRPSQQRKTLRGRRHPGREVSCCRERSPYEQLARCPAPGGASSETCWISTPFHHAESSKAHAPGGESSRKRKLEGRTQRRRRICPKGRKRKRERRPQREEQRRRKERILLEESTGTAERGRKRRRRQMRGGDSDGEALTLSSACSAEGEGSMSEAVACPGTVEGASVTSGGREQPPLDSSSEKEGVLDPCDGLGASPNNSEGAGNWVTQAVRPRNAAELASFEWPHQLGQRLAEGIFFDQLPNGFKEFLTEVKHFASQDAFIRGRGIFPLPVNFDPVSSSNCSGRAPGVQAWLPLVCLALNSLSGCKKVAPRQRTGAQVKKVLETLEDRISRFLSLFKCPLHIDPHEAWKDVTSKRLTYEGEEYADPVPLTHEQILKSLPPSGHGGSVELLPLLVGQARHLLAHPEEVLLSREYREEGPNTAKVHIASGESLSVWKLLEERGIIEWIPLSSVHCDHQGRFLSGMFGVEKPNRFADSGAPLLRVIMNLKPINRALRIIKGDIEQLPAPTLWNHLVLGLDEKIVASQADMSSAFYLFRLPRVWLPYLAFNSKFSGKDLGLPTSELLVPSCRVLPMGWSSSVGLMQMVSRELLLRRDMLGADELRRQMLAPAWFIDIALRQGPKAFWQVYLDNFMAAEISKMGEEATLSQRLHSTAVESWTEHGVLCAQDKHVIGSVNAIELGVQLDSQAGLVGGSPERFHKLLTVTIMLLEQRLPKVKWVQVVLGRWVFILQYRRPAMSVLSKCWNYMQKADRRRWWPIVRKELTSLLFLAPLLHTDLRTTFSPLVTCSDASHFGGAVASSVALGSAGVQLAHRLKDPCYEPVAAPLLVVSAFNGIGGAFRGYDLAGVRPAGLIAIEWDKAAQRVTRKAWPNVIELGDIQLITKATVKEWANLFPRVTHVHLIGGFPCVHLSSARAGRQNLSGDGSRLFWNLVNLIQWLHEVFGHFAHIEFIIENVLSMDVSAREEISRVLGVQPIAMCPSDFLPYNRPRLAWISAEVFPTEGTTFEQCGDYVRVHMAGQSFSLEQWMEPGWSRTSDVCFPTFMKAIKRRAPPPKPAGLARCDERCLSRWESDSFRYPPYQYKHEYLLSHPSKGLRYLSAEEREMLLGFGWQHTRSAMSASHVKQSPQEFEDKRLSLCGDSFSMLSFGWAISQLCRAWVAPLSPQQIVDRFGLAPGAGLASFVPAPLQRSLGYGSFPPGANSEATLVQYLARHVNHTGSDVSLALGIPMSRKGQNHASLRADWWQWKILFKTRWQFPAHINYLEMKMVLQAICWRARNANSLNSRWIHLADSMVSNFILSKGRTSSLLLQPLTQQVAAFLLALNSTQLNAHVDSIENPTDEASRQTHDSERKHTWREAGRAPGCILARGRD